MRFGNKTTTEIKKAHKSFNQSEKTTFFNPTNENWKNLNCSINQIKECLVAKKDNPSRQII
jgi:hypothetical protein